jgi:hypothetical protein
MAKTHTRNKRKLNTRSRYPRKKNPRVKSFKSEEAAKKYAESKGLKDFKLVNLKSTSSKKKKIKVVAK